MSHFPNKYWKQRAPRVELSGAIMVLPGLANRAPVRGKLHQLSINGGLLQ
jgi:hypothetical protein